LFRSRVPDGERPGVTHKQLRVVENGFRAVAVLRAQVGAQFTHRAFDLQDELRRGDPHLRQRPVAVGFNIKPLPQPRSLERKETLRAFASKRQRVVGERQQFRRYAFRDWLKATPAPRPHLFSRREQPLARFRPQPKCDVSAVVLRERQARSCDFR
jgi:hypothetical protein